ncbi:hypothetical protein NDU88_007338 [Pleurodeles waltl]|uniref:Uncharacterized protein n=1 Tax=Pleurodeles waltl TaxID=8319 RepID=A0AAV7MEX5_PLEWA|nr:hypothetical protein NDU88_007338 [Pleurodeles waltl]
MLQYGADRVAVLPSVAVVPWGHGGEGRDRCMRRRSRAEKACVWGAASHKMEAVSAVRHRRPRPPCWFIGGFMLRPYDRAFEWIYLLRENQDRYRNT